MICKKADNFFHAEKRQKKKKALFSRNAALSHLQELFPLTTEPQIISHIKAIAKFEFVKMTSFKLNLNTVHAIEPNSQDIYQVLSKSAPYLVRYR